jgi:hypothetical protein
MKRIKFGFRNQSADATLNLCERAVQNLAGLAPEHLADVPHAELAGTVAATRASHDRIAGLRAELKAEISRRNELLRAAREQTTRCVNWAAMNMNHDPVKMMSTGFGLQAPWAKVSPPAAPTKLHAEPTATAGEAQLTWKRPLRDGWFELQMQMGEFKPDGWQPAEASCYQQRCRLEGLVSGGLYWFRVRACNRRGESPWSELATARVK